MKNATPKIRNIFSPRVRVALMCTEEERRTKSEFADECDINLIMARARKTGIDPYAARLAASQYGDFGQLPDYMEMRDKLIAAERMFLELPATVRKQFDNDPGQFIAAANTPEGREVMKKFGLGADSEAIPASPAASSSAGQAEGAGTEPARPKTPANAQSPKAAKPSENNE